MEPTPETFPIIGLGASAGGLEALKSFFSEVSETGGMAYVIVVHLPSDTPSMMPELLGKIARIPVSTAEDGQVVAPDHAYVIPPNKEISIFKGRFQLLAMRKTIPHLPIDVFLRSLAQDQGRRAAAVILSGTGTDGSLGAREIKANNGLILAQSEESAGYDGMPRSVINTGLVDVVLPPERMPAKLARYFTNPATTTDGMGDAASANEPQPWLDKILVVLRARTGNDFSSYKASTTRRRISRRMALNGIDDHDNYIRYLRENRAEADALFHDLLIGVTRFFRDADSFNALKSDVLLSVLKQMEEDAVFRAWIPGCSTGEEVYSLAMTLRECLDHAPKRIGIQLFGTDIDDFAINKAREGLFPASIAADVSPERLKRFFAKDGDFFRIRKDIRDIIVFSVQNLIKDPPFSRLNLLCCRNLLIYLNADTQKKLLPLFHYTLKPDGLLMLGSSETIGGFTDLFDVVDKKWKIYRRMAIPHALPQGIDFPGDSPDGARADKPLFSPADARKPADLAQATRKALLDGFTPTAALIDERGDILYVQGRTGKYLETPSGPPSRNILDLAREGLRIELSSAIRSARSSMKPVTRKQVLVKTNGGAQPIDLHVRPQREPEVLAGRFLVVFEDVPARPAAGAGKDDGAEPAPEGSRIDELEKELQITRESHQATVEELESANEELTSTNEELQSANEELQSTNEELESSKEELQSLNEELQTVNAELQSKVSELSDTHDDMRNLLNGTEIATIFVDNDLRVRRFTPEATTIVNLIPSDTGRPLRHVATNLAYDGMIADLKEVLRKLAPTEIELQTTEGVWYKMRSMPYRTTDNRIDGAVLTFANIDDQKKAQESLKASKREVEGAWELTRALFDMNPDPMAVLDEDGKVVIANTALSGRMAIPQEEIEGTDLLGTSQTSNAVQSAELKAAVEEGRDFTLRGFEMNTPDGKERFTVAGGIIRKDEHTPYRILLRFTTEDSKET